MKVRRTTDSLTFGWNIEPRKMGRFVKGYTRAVREDILRLIERRTTDIEQWMRDNAVWKDRTGNARDSLRAELTDFTRGVFQLSLYYDDLFEERANGPRYYAIYLETMQAGKYAILSPAMDYWGQVLFNDIQRIMRNKGIT